MNDETSFLPPFDHRLVEAVGGLDRVIKAATAENPAGILRTGGLVVEARTEVDRLLASIRAGITIEFTDGTFLGRLSDDNAGRVIGK